MADVGVRVVECDEKHLPARGSELIEELEDRTVYITCSGRDKTTEIPDTRAYKIQREGRVCSNVQG
jgi:hypothetical protein